ncbi:MAG: hypothetical protein U9N42_03880 [Campylobacterota bacterium]|nr:hypothetical protein [Campylobacterota bacterium]
MKKDIQIVEDVVGFFEEHKNTECATMILNLLSELGNGTIDESEILKYDDTKFFYIEQCFSGVDIKVYFSEHEDYFKILDIKTNIEECA